MGDQYERILKINLLVLSASLMCYLIQIPSSIQLILGLFII